MCADERERERERERESERERELEGKTRIVGRKIKNVTFQNHPTRWPY